MGIKIGLVGLGAFGNGFADLFKAHPLVDRVALCDREPERMEVFASKASWQDKFNRKDCYQSMDAICKADLDALVIITQPWLHAPQCLQALESGKHVYSAVPIACIPDGDEILDWCDKLVAACKRTGLHYMMGETTYFHPESMYCRRRAKEGAFGQFTYTEGEYYHGFDSPECDLRKVVEHRSKGAAGQEGVKLQEAYTKRGVRTGPMHYPTHSTSGPICVMGAHATKVCCWGQGPFSSDPFFKHDNCAFSNETALFQMSNGATMRICEHRECSVGREVFRIHGTKGSYENGFWQTFADGAVLLNVDEMRDPLPPEVAQAFSDIRQSSDFYGEHGGSHAYLVHEFVDAIAHNRHPAINVWEAARYMAAGVMAHKSALKDGEILAVPDWGDAPK